LRYQLIPYIYSVAAQIPAAGTALIRALALEFPGDTATHDLTDQYLFGPSFMVCPVTSPMYYGANSQPITGAEKTRSVHLPSGTDWYDFWTNLCYSGGQRITVDAPLETMPLFVPAGSIIPMGPVTPFVDATTDATYEIRIYRGADGKFLLYEDEGDNYNYEQNARSFVRFTWNEQCAELRISFRAGTFRGMTKERPLRIVAISPTRTVEREITYSGDGIILVLE